MQLKRGEKTSSKMKRPFILSILLEIVLSNFCSVVALILYEQDSKFIMIAFVKSPLFKPHFAICVKNLEAAMGTIDLQGFIKVLLV
jgi:hypothetical protein